MHMHSGYKDSYNANSAFDVGIVYLDYIIIYSMHRHFNKHVLFFIFIHIYTRVFLMLIDDTLSHVAKVLANQTTGSVCDQYAKWVITNIMVILLRRSLQDEYYGLLCRRMILNSSCEKKQVLLKFPK